MVLRVIMQTLNLIQSELTENKSYDTYLTAIRGNIRGLYYNDLSLFQFIDAMMSTVERNLIQAWNAGATECGILPPEMTPQELTVRDNYINNQFRYILGLGQAIELDRNVVRIGEALSRADMWANRWYEMQALGNETVCADIKTLWQWNPGKEHCVDCQNMNGRVYRNSTWAKYGIRPGSANLACFGGHCGCRRIPTDLPITPGRPPALVGPGGGGRKRR